MSQFRCPVCHSNQYGRIEKRLPNGLPYLSSLYRCLQCNFGFTDLDQFMREAAASSQQQMAK